MVIEENLPLVLIFLKNQIKMSDLNAYPLMFQEFFQQFSCGDPQNSDTGIYLMSIYFELLLKYCIIMMTKHPEKLDSFHFLYDPNLNIQIFLLKILRFIYRSINMVKSETAESMIMPLRSMTFKIIIFSMKMSISNYYPLDYLNLIKIVFKATSQAKVFEKYFIEEIEKKKINILEYFIQLHKSGIKELQIMATELSCIIPLEMKSLISHYPDYAKDYIPIISQALTFSDQFIINRAIRDIEHIINSNQIIKVDLIGLLQPQAEELFINMNRILMFMNSKDIYEYPKYASEGYAIISAVKILARFFPFLRELQIEPMFKSNPEFIIGFLDR